MNITDLVSHVAPEVPGCNVISIERALVEAVRAFCAATWVWSHETTAWIRAGKNTGALRVPASLSVCDLISWESETTSVAPVLYRGTDLQVENDVEEDTQYSVVLAVRPGQTATEYPDWFDDQYRPAITAHAAHALLMLPGKDWTNPNRAQLLYQTYIDAVNAAKRAYNHNRLRGNVRVKNTGVR